MHLYFHIQKCNLYTLNFSMRFKGNHYYEIVDETKNKTKTCF